MYVFSHTFTRVTHTRCAHSSTCTRSHALRGFRVLHAHASCAHVYVLPRAGGRRRKFACLDRDVFRALFVLSVPCCDKCPNIAPAGTYKEDPLSHMQRVWRQGQDDAQYHYLLFHNDMYTVRLPCLAESTLQITSTPNPSPPSLPRE